MQKTDPVTILNNFNEYDEMSSFCGNRTESTVNEEIVSSAYKNKLRKCINSVRSFLFTQN